MLFRSDGLRLQEETRADVARYDALLKKLAIVAVLALPVLAAHTLTEVPYGAA